MPSREYRAPTQWIGWEPDGDALVLRQADVLWRWDGEHLVDSTFVNPMFDTRTIEAADVLGETLVASIRVSSGAIPGIWAFDEWTLVVADLSGATPEILGRANGMRYSAGAGPTILWTETHITLDPESETEDEFLTSQAHRIDRDGGQADLEAPTGGEPLLSPSGDRIAWAKLDATLLTDLAGQQVQHVDAFAKAVAWHPSGRTLAGRDGDVWLFELDSGELRHLNVERATDLAWSPDGEALAVETACEAATERRIRIFDDGGERWSTECSVGYFAAWSPDGRRFALSRLDRAHGSTGDGPTRIVVVGDGPGPEIEGGFLGFRPH